MGKERRCLQKKFFDEEEIDEEHSSGYDADAYRHWGGEENKGRRCLRCKGEPPQMNNCETAMMEESGKLLSGQALLDFLKGLFGG